MTYQTDDLADATVPAQYLTRFIKSALEHYGDAMENGRMGSVSLDAARKFTRDRELRDLIEQDRAECDRYYAVLAALPDPDVETVAEGSDLLLTQVPREALRDILREVMQDDAEALTALIDKRGSEEETRERLGRVNWCQAALDALDREAVAA